MKIYIATETGHRVFAASLTVEDLKKRMESEVEAYYHTADIDIDIDFLEATLKAKHLEADMFRQRNQAKAQRLMGILGCTEEAAMKILRDNENTEIHQPDESEQVRRKS